MDRAISKTLVVGIVLYLAVIAKGSNSEWVTPAEQGNDTTLPALTYYLCQHGLKTGMTLNLSHLTQYDISAGKFCMIQNVMNVSIVSEEGQANISCSNETGFGFFNVTNLLFENLTFIGCGAELKLPASVNEVLLTNTSNLYIGSGQAAVLFFFHCYNPKLSSITVKDNFRGIGILFINSYGLIDISKVTATDKQTNSWSPVTLNNFTSAGGGAVFVFMDSLIDPLVDPAVVSLRISHALFSRNTQAFTHGVNILDIFSQSNTKAPILSASGIAVFLATTTYSVNVTISKLKIFNSYNSHIGAMLVVYHRTTAQHDIHLTNINVSRNLMPMLPSFQSQAVSSGLTFIVSSNENTFDSNVPPATLVKSADKSKIIISNATFAFNYGIRGVGILFIAQPFSYVNFDFIMKQATFHHNSGLKSGIGMYMEISTINRFDYTCSLNILLSEVNVTQNRYWFTGFEVDKRYHYGNAMFSFNNIPKVLFHTNNTFAYNNGSAIKVYNGVLEIRDKFLCKNNTAIVGGCLSLQGLSYLWLTKTTYAIFQANHALISGGAIHGDTMGISTDVCTLQPYNGTSMMRYPLVFDDNRADLDGAGSDIKITNIYDCWLLFNTTLRNYQMQNNFSFYEDIFLFKQNSSISGEANSITLCENNGLATTEQSLYSGQTVTIPVIVKDKQSNPISANTLVTQIAYSGGSFHIIGEDYHSLYPRCNVLNFTLTSSEFNKTVAGEMKLQSTGSSKAYFNFHIEISPCPIGFYVNQKADYRCDCSPFLQELNLGIVCNIDNTIIQLPHSSWFGSGMAHDSKEAFSARCPPEYCYADRPPSFNSTLTDPLCKHNRTGIMCGHCPQGLSQVFGSHECRECTNVWLVTIAMYMLLGFALVLFLFYTKLTISSGFLGGIVFFSNMSTISLHMDLLDQNASYTIPIRILIASLNLNMGHAICFYDGMTSVTKTAMLFVFPVYIWCLVFLLIVVSRCSVKLSNLIVGSSIQVLMSLMQLSFAKLLFATSNILTSANLWVTSADSDKPVTKLIWYFDGNETYFSGQHLILFCISLVVLVLFIMPYLFFTTVIPHIGYCRTIHLFNPLIDSYCGPYKTKHRYWFGVRQLIITVLYILYATLRGGHPQIMLIINIFVLFLFLTAQIYIKPFTNELVNIVDSAFIYILCLTDFVTYFYIRNDEIDSSSSSPVISVFLTVYLIITLTIIVIYSLKAYKKTRKVMTRLSNFVQGRLFNSCSRHDLQYDDDEVIDYCRLREPLLTNSNDSDDN